MSWEAEARALRAELAELRAHIASVESARVIPPVLPIIGRIKAETTTSGGDRSYTVVAQRIDPAGAVQKVDDDFDLLHVRALDKDGMPQSRGHDVLVLDFGHFKAIAPCPNRLVYVEDVGSGAALSGREAKWLDIDTGGPSAPAFADALPVLFTMASSKYIASTFPTKTGNVYPAIHVRPLPGASISGVDDDDGFFVVQLMAPGSLADTISKTLLVNDGDTIELELDRDGQGNLLDARLTKS
jgi:hypothetical protein